MVKSFWCKALKRYNTCHKQYKVIVKVVEHDTLHDTHVASGNTSKYIIFPKTLILKYECFIEGFWLKLNKEKNN